MRVDREISKRMRDILTKDKVNIKEGFFTALSKDVERLCKDYFQTEGKINIEIEQGDDGKYEVKISFLASKIKQFETTYDIKRY